MKAIFGVMLAVLMLASVVSADSFHKSNADNKARIANARAAWLAGVNERVRHNYVPLSHFSSLASSRPEARMRWAEGWKYVGEGKAGCTKSKPYEWCWDKSKKV